MEMKIIAEQEIFGKKFSIYGDFENPLYCLEREKVRLMREGE